MNKNTKSAHSFIAKRIHSNNQKYINDQFFVEYKISGKESCNLIIILFVHHKCILSA